MRRLIWCSAIFMMAAAAWFYLAATYVSEYPDSYLSRCAAFAYRMGTDMNPTYRLGVTAVNSVREGLGRVLEGGRNNTDRRASRTLPPRCPDRVETPCGNALRELVPPQQMDDEILGVWSNDAVKSVPKMIVLDADAEESATAPTTTFNLAVAASVEAPDDGAPKSMPPCPEDEAEKAPATMPYLEDDADEDDAAVRDVLDKALKVRDRGRLIVPPQAGTTTSGEESENTPEPGASSDHYGNPESNYGMPESETTHHNCPEPTVTCPYTGRSYPADPRDDVQTSPTKPKKKKKKATPTASTSDKINIKEYYEQLEKAAQGVVVHPEVDTTEYRKSDAHNGEFQPMPE